MLFARGSGMSVGMPVVAFGFISNDGFFFNMGLISNDLMIDCFSSSDSVASKPSAHQVLFVTASLSQ
jgi:hypothetical protein